MRRNDPIPDMVFARFQAQPNAGSADAQPEDVGHVGTLATTKSDWLQGLTNVLEFERPRWFLWVPAAFAAGATSYFSLSFEPSVLTVLACLLAALALAMAARKRPTIWAVLSGLLVIAAFGLTAAKTRTLMVAAPVMAADTGELKASGFVELIEPRAKGGSRMTLRLTNLADYTDDTRPVRIRVASRTAITTIRIGDHITAWVKLRPPSAPATPGDYDFARYAWFKSLGGVGFLTHPPEMTPFAGPTPWMV
ncbi:MAG: DUF4131 domain-containing protein, partial [Pseudomonadota bacterium]